MVEDRKLTLKGRPKLTMLVAIIPTMLASLFSCKWCNIWNRNAEPSMWVVPRPATIPQYAQIQKSTHTQKMELYETVRTAEVEVWKMILFGTLSSGINSKPKRSYILFKIKSVAICHTSNMDRALFWWMQLLYMVTIRCRQKQNAANKYRCWTQAHIQATHAQHLSTGSVAISQSTLAEMTLWLEAVWSAPGRAEVGHGVSPRHAPAPHNSRRTFLGTFSGW